MAVNVRKRSVGVNFSGSGEAEIVVWAPLADNVEIIISNESPGWNIALEKQSFGYWKTETPKIKPGSLYKISVNNDTPLPDPASLSQPLGVHEASCAIDINNYTWTDNKWKNHPLQEYIIYELHTGTFTPEHNFEGIKSKLDHLSDLGITAIEIMPVGQFPGSRNWGYDGVYPFAVQQSYGGADKLQELVNACHEKNIAVILDVVYNHIGPEGNYFGRFGPYFTEKYSTPWGKSLNFDDAWCNGVREYFIENALMWFRDFHIDALRMDAVHAIKDLGPDHLTKNIREKVNELSAITGRHHYLIAELDLNDPVFINSPDKCGYGMDAQWIDEFHHALRVTSGQKKEGYYSDFNGIAHLSKSYNDAYVYDGQFSLHRKKFFGAKTVNPGYQFVVFSQNHDQTGNRMLGERSSQLVSYEMCKLMAAAVMIGPFLPMLFMGEEWAEPHPFLFFISHTDKELASIVNKGRKAEFASFSWEGEPPDPRLEQTFNDSLLQWDIISKDPHAKMLKYYKKLIELRKTQPALKSTDREGIGTEVNKEKNTLVLHRVHSKQHIVCLMNYSKTIREIKLSEGHWRKLLDSASPEWNGGHSAAAIINENPVATVQPESILIYERN